MRAAGIETCWGSAEAPTYQVARVEVGLRVRTFATSSRSFKSVSTAKTTRNRRDLRRPAKFLYNPTTKQEHDGGDRRKLVVRAVAVSSADVIAAATFATFRSSWPRLVRLLSSSASIPTARIPSRSSRPARPM